MKRWVAQAIAYLFLLSLLACLGPQGPGTDADLLAALPADVDLVAFVDVLAVQEHPLWQKLQDDPFLEAGEETLAQFQEITGLDPFRDVHMLVFAARGIGQPDMEMAVFARGDFDRDRLDLVLGKAGWQEERRGNLRMYAPDPDAEETISVPDLENTRLAFLDDYTIAVGATGLLGDAADVDAGSREPLVETSDMGPLIREGLGSGQFWGVFRSGYLGDRLRDRIEEGIPMLGVLRGFSGVQVVRYSMRFSDSIDLVARARTSTEGEAQLLADTLNGFLALAKLAAKDQPAVLRFLEGALVGLDLDSVRLSMNVDGATLDRIRGGLLENLGPGADGF